MNSREIRKQFLDFFKEKGHKIVPSSPVVPFEDPTLLFTNAGMNQFKDVFLGTGTREYSRAADSQKCIRAGGKHNDLDEVGMDGYHHTFFEMLGNWSFGDYYKKEAITWAWELLTQVYNLPKDRLWVTVFKTDDEAELLWKTETDIDHSHILRFDEKDNFWEMGDTGPCGPCSEIHIDLTKEGCRKEDINAGLEDVIEIWNLVFIQYNRDQTGKLNPLPKRHVDTGMGFERIVRTIQGKKSNYETDLFQPIIKIITSITGKEYSGENISFINAIADHIRSLVFAISDGAIPSNEGRGYVLRRILRRALRLARKLDYNKPILHNLVDVVVDNFGDVYPEIKEKKDLCKKIIHAEEESFGLTIDRGLKLFNEISEKLKKNGIKEIPGIEAFKLYDTYGFPFDLTEIMARELNLSVDVKGFEAEMEKQKQRARSARKENMEVAEAEAMQSIDSSIQSEYDPYTISEDGIKTKVLNVSEISGKNITSLVLEKNIFFTESGGQISDTGELISSSGEKSKVIDSKQQVYIYVKGSNTFKKGDQIIAKIDIERRKAIERNHSATHLLHESLKRVLGSHVKQMGSLVADEYLRFDFPHFKKLDSSELNDIESMVNSKISEEIDVNTFIDMPIEEAKKIPNAKMFFGEKYGDFVRVVFIDENFSIEFCGGTHVINTNKIGLFKITKEESISSGTRRITARTGTGIIKLIDDKISDIEHILNEIPEKHKSDFTSAVTDMKSQLLKADFTNAALLKKLLQHNDESFASLNTLKQKLAEEKKKHEKELLKQNIGKLKSDIESLVSNSETISGINIASGRITAISSDELKEAGEHLYRILNNGAALLASEHAGKVNLICAVSDNLIKEKNLNAGKIISEPAKILGGGGGGKPHLATAGGKDASRIDEAFKKFRETIKTLIEG